MKSMLENCAEVSKWLMSICCFLAVLAFRKCPSHLPNEYTWKMGTDSGSGNRANEERMHEAIQGQLSGNYLLLNCESQVQCEEWIGRLMRINVNWLKYGVSVAFVQLIERMKSTGNFAMGEKCGRSCSRWKARVYIDFISSSFCWGLGHFFAFENQLLCGAHSIAFVTWGSLWKRGCEEWGNGLVNLLVSV